MTTMNKMNSAAMHGLLLSLITIIASLLQTTFEIKSMLVSTLLWAVKFGGCIFTLHYFMKQYSLQSEKDHVSYGESFRYGLLVCLFSSVVCAGYMLLSLTILFPEQVDVATEQINTVLASGSYNSDQEKAVNSILDRLPQLTFIYSLIYYIIIGAVMSSIIANYTKKENPFAPEN